MTITLAAPIIIESDDALVRLSRDNPGYRIEREEDGTITMSPTHTEGAAKSLKAGVPLDRYASTAGGKAFASSTGFNVGPRKKNKSPDASWISQPNIDELTRLGKAEKYWPISPNVIIEVSPIPTSLPIPSPTRSTFASAAHATPSRSTPTPARSSNSGPHRKA